MEMVSTLPYAAFDTKNQMTTGIQCCYISLSISLILSLSLSLSHPLSLSLSQTPNLCC